MNFKKPLLLILLIGFIATAVWLLRPATNPVSPSTEPQRLSNIESILPIPNPWTGDFDGMLERRLVRILVPYSKTLYFLDRGQARGVVHDAGREFEKWLNRKHGTKTLPIRVVFIPTARTHLLQDLLDGYGDIAAGNLTITEERKKIVDFTETGLRNIDEIVVTGPDSPVITQLSDLEDVPIYLRESSSYHEHLKHLEKECGFKFDIKPADEILEDADLLEMVNSGLLPMAIVDDHKARLWVQVFDELQLHEGLAINRGGRIAWAIRKGSPKFKAELDIFGLEEGRRKGLANILTKRYLGTADYVARATDEEALKRFDALAELFQRHAETYDLDALLLMAQGYQESKLNQKARSHAGAVGIMQLLPRTAASKPIGIEEVEADIDKNIEAGAKYLRYLMDTYLNDPEIDERNRLLLGMATYNTGPGNMRKIRQKTVEMGLDPNRWFNNVEHGAARIIGRETVQYVSNIYKYYLAYLLVEEQRRNRLQKASVSTP